MFFLLSQPSLFSPTSFRRSTHIGKEAESRSKPLSLMLGKAVILARSMGDSDLSPRVLLMPTFFSLSPGAGLCTLGTGLLLALTQNR
jgi:hypothetical protein